MFRFFFASELYKISLSICSFVTFSRSNYIHDREHLILKSLEGSSPAVRSHAARRCRFNRGIFHGSVSCVRSSPLTNSEVRAKSIKFIECAPAARKRTRLGISIYAVLERHGYTCRGCGAVLLRCYDVPSVLTCSRNTCSAAIIIAAGYNVSAVKHARQEGFGEVY